MMYGNQKRRRINILKREVKFEGEKIDIACKARPKSPSLYCNCFNNQAFAEKWLQNTKMRLRKV